MENFEFARNKSNDKSGSKHILTPLVDCFAIILIYLLMATSFGQIEVKIPEGMKLPKATEGKAPTGTLVIEVKNQSYVINGVSIPLPRLSEELKKIADSSSAKQALIIQADRGMSYGEINPVVIAGLQAGFSELQFAVVNEQEKM